MRTANEIFEEAAYFNKWLRVLTDNECSLIEELINEARKEAIIEAANVAKDDVLNGFSNPEGLKDSILSLIDELK